MNLIKWLEKFKRVESPCINDCVISYDDKNCRGCKRYPKEIEEWESLTEQEKRDLLTELRKRKNAG